EEWLQFHSFLQKDERSNVKCSSPADTFNDFLSLQERLIEQVAAFIRQLIEHHQRDGYLCHQCRRWTLTAEALLQQRKWKDLTVLKGDDFSIRDQRHREVSSCLDDFRKLMSNVVQRARVQRRATIAHVQLTADAVVFVFNEKRI